jgi:hypothetical protein
MARKHKTRSKLGVTKRVLREARQRLGQKKQKLCQAEDQRYKVQDKILYLQEIFIDRKFTSKEYCETSSTLFNLARYDFDILRVELSHLNSDISKLKGDISFASYWIPRIENQQDQPSDFSNISLEAQRQNLKDILRIRRL